MADFDGNPFADPEVNPFAVSAVTSNFMLTACLEDEVLCKLSMVL